MIRTCLFLAALLHSAEPAPRLPRENLLLYRGDDGKPKPVEKVEDWTKRRAEIVRGMETVMGKLPGQEKRCPLDVKVEEEVDCGKYVRRLLSYESEPGSRVPAYLCIPKAVLKGAVSGANLLSMFGRPSVKAQQPRVGFSPILRTQHC